MYHYIKISCIFFAILFLNTSVQAQKKQNRKSKEALQRRFESDKKYASYQRGIYNREEWKQSWIGVKYSDLLKSWGAPTRSLPDGEGGQIIVYEKVSNFSGGMYKPGYITTATNGFGQTVVTNVKESEDTRWASQTVETTTVYVDKNNIIKKLDYDINSNRR